MASVRRRVASGGGRGGNAPRFSFLPPSPPRIFSCPLRHFFGRKKLVFLGGKNVKICDFGQKKPSDFGEDLFFWRSTYCFLAGKFVMSAKKSLWISAKTFFFFRSPAFGRKVCDFGQKKPSHFGENLCPLILILSPTPPPRSREAGDAPVCRRKC